MKDKDIIEDAFQLCFGILKDEKLKGMAKQQEMMISIEDVGWETRQEYRWYYYKNILTPSFLQRKGIIELLPDDSDDLRFMGDPLERVNPQGFFYIKIDLQKARNWAESIMNARLSSILTHPKANYKRTGDCKGELFVAGIKIDELTGNQAALCEVIFRDEQSKKKEWSNGDILEEWGENFETRPASSIYTAAHGIREKVARKMHIENKFFITTRRTVKLNPEFV